MSFGRAFFVYQTSQKIADLITVIASWYLCWFLRFETSFFPITKGVPDFGSYARVALPLAAVFSAILHLIGAYRSDRTEFGFRALKKIFEGAVLGTLVFIAVCYFEGEIRYSRIYLAVFAIVVFTLLTLERWGLDFVWRRRLQHLPPQTLLFIGKSPLSNYYRSQLENHLRCPFEIKGTLTGSETPSQLKAFLEKETVDTAIVAFPGISAEECLEVLEILSNTLVTVKLLPDYGKYNTFSYTSSSEFGVPQLLFNQVQFSYSDRMLKRLIDFWGAAFFLIFAFPVFAAIALWIKLTSKGPVFYSQVRVGADGKEFKMYKFRSMRIDAEKNTGAVWAVKEDDRVTPFGRFLRKSSLDEIPQFYNVLKGDMALVGPRPERPFFVEQFKKEIPKYMLRHKMKSGITGWAQVNGWRGNTSLEERIKHDLYYIGHWSLLFDIKILILTLFRGFVHPNAY